MHGPSFFMDKRIRSLDSVRLTHKWETMGVYLMVLYTRFLKYLISRNKVKRKLKAIQLVLYTYTEVINNPVYNPAAHHGDKITFKTILY